MTEVQCPRFPVLKPFEPVPLITPGKAPGQIHMYEVKTVCSARADQSIHAGPSR